MKINLAVKSLSALAQETRLSIFRILVQAGETGLSAGQIAKALSIPNATLSFHLKELSNAELVLARQESRFIYYSANFVAMNELLGFLTENCCAGIPCAPDLNCCEGELVTSDHLSVISGELHSGVESSSLYKSAHGDSGAIDSGKPSS